MPKLPGPLKRSKAWVVMTYRFATDDDIREHLIDHDELQELIDKHGEDSDEVADALGPSHGAVSVFPYGPYTEAQARSVVDALSRPETQRREHIDMAMALPLNRFVAALSATEETRDGD